MRDPLLTERCPGCDNWGDIEHRDRCMMARIARSDELLARTWGVAWLAGSQFTVDAAHKMMTRRGSIDFIQLGQAIARCGKAEQSIVPGGSASAGISALVSEAEATAKRLAHGHACENARACTEVIRAD